MEIERLNSLKITLNKQDIFNLLDCSYIKKELKADIYEDDNCLIYIKINKEDRKYFMDVSKSENKRFNKKTNIKK